MSKDTPYVNPKDPLHQPTAGPDAARELFSAFSKVAHGFSRADAIMAAANILLNAIRQENPTRIGAERAFDELLGRSKNVLLEHHYDLTGKRRNIFPFHQTMNIPHLDLRKRN
jgi:hypothetical protein